MARKSRRRFYRKKGRWCSNIEEISQDIVGAASGYNYATATLAFNPVQTSTGTSQIYTVKNFEISFTFEYPTNDTGLDDIEDICVYIMFVPQGMNVGSNYNNIHPEYIMAYKFIGSPANDTSNTGQQYHPYKVKSRLARKLNTGDSVQLFIKYSSPGAISGKVMEVHGINRWWTKAN